MKKLYFTALCIFSVVPVAAYAEPSANDLYQACYRQFKVISDVMECAKRKFETSEAQLAQQEAQEPKMFDAWFEDEYFKADSRKYTPVSNQEFEKYKKKYCDFSIYLMRDTDTATHEIHRLSCLTSQNLHYLALLKVDLAYTQRKLE